MRKQALHPRTAIINHKQKHQAKTARLEALRWLSAKFPQAFDNTTCIRPLKKGIMKDILAYANDALAYGISKSKLREAVVVFTRRVDYLTVLKAREMRIDLQGNTVESVSEEEAEAAALKLRKRVERCAKNARKTAASKPYISHQRSIGNLDEEKEGESSCFESGTNYSSSSGLNSSKSASVIVKRKPRQYDPDAVARLKEKLGLAKKKESME